MNETPNIQGPETGKALSDEPERMQEYETEIAETGEAEYVRQPLGKRQIAVIVILIVFAIMSFFVFSGAASDEGNFSGTYKVLTEKQNAVLGMTAAATAASVAITVIPDDVGTPIAEELADLSGYFIFILCAVFLEKWLLTTFGLLAFKFIIPIAIAFLIIGMLIASEKMKKISVKFIIFALIVFFIVPLSAAITRQMDESYQANANQAVEEMNKDADEVNEASKDESALDKFLNTFKNGAIGLASKFKEKVSEFAEFVACFIVTTCVIPICVVLVIVWLIKMLTGADINPPRLPKGRKVLRKIRK